MKTLLAMLLFHAVLAANDVTGTWSGTVKMAEGSDSDHLDTAYLVLKQEGDKLTGTAGESSAEQWKIRDGKVSGDQVSFVVEVDDSVFKAVLTLAKDVLTGEVRRERDGQVRTMKVELKRVT